MLLDFNTKRMNRTIFSPSPERKDKGWSYSFVYYLKDIKTIYSIYYIEKRSITIPELLKICQRNNVVSESGKKWTNRNLLEIVNALKNFEFIDKTTNIARAGNLFSAETKELTEKDKDVLRNVYKSYFRFCDFHKLFASVNSFPTLLYAFKEEQRFFNRFARIDKNEIYCIEDTHQDTMRFWEVYTKWGETLELLNKCLASSFDSEFDNLLYRNIYVCNLTRPMPDDFSICNYIQKKMAGKAYYIPDIEWNLITEFGYSIGAIKRRILDECLSNSSCFRLQKASFLTVDPDELKLFPIVGNTYMSHILKIS
jgi:hypothetical protein